MPIKKRIIWAFDPGPDNQQLQESCLQLLTRLSEYFDLSIQPVSVLMLHERDMNNPKMQEWINDYKGQVCQALEKIIQENSEISNWLDPEILEGTISSLTKSIDVFVEYAKQTKTNLVLLGTHAKKGLTRLFLGSFAETLAIRSDLPLLVVNPQASLPDRFDKILFPTDFSPPANRAFDNVIEFAKELGAELTVFHQVDRPIEPFIPAGAYTWGVQQVPIAEYYEQAIIDRGKQAKEWVLRAEEKGINASYYIDHGEISLPEAIHDYAGSHDFSLIAMPTQCSRIEAVFPGSNTRHVLRSSEIPVWTVHIDESSDKKA